jgi:hypothetical protein
VPGELPATKSLKSQTIDPADFASVDWRLVSGGAAITVT